MIYKMIKVIIITFIFIVFYFNLSYALIEEMGGFDSNYKMPEFQSASSSDNQILDLDISISDVDNPGFFSSVFPSSLNSTGVTLKDVSFSVSGTEDISFFANNGSPEDYLDNLKQVLRAYSANAFSEIYGGASYAANEIRKQLGDSALRLFLARFAYPGIFLNEDMSADLKQKISDTMLEVEDVLDNYILEEKTINLKDIYQSSFNEFETIGKVTENSMQLKIGKYIISLSKESKTEVSLALLKKTDTGGIFNNAMLGNKQISYPEIQLADTCLFRKQTSVLIYRDNEAVYPQMFIESMIKKNNFGNYVYDEKYFSKDNNLVSKEFNGGLYIYDLVCTEDTKSWEGIIYDRERGPDRENYGNILDLDVSISGITDIITQTSSFLLPEPFIFDFNQP